MGDVQGAEAYLEESLEIARGLDDGILCVDVLFHLSLLRRDQGRLAEARDCLEECIDLSIRQRDDAQIAAFKAQLGVLNIHMDYHIAEAKQYLAQGRDLFHQLGNKDDESICLYNLGRLAYEQGHFDESKELLLESLKLRRYLGSPYVQESILSTLGEMARDKGHYQEAQSHFLQSLDISRQLQSPVGQLYALVDLGDIAKRHKDDAAAANYCKKALKLAAADLTPRGVLIEVLYFVAAYLQTRSAEEAYLAAAYLSQQEGISQHLKDKIKQLASQLMKRLPAQLTKNLQAKTKDLSLESLLAKQLSLLEAA
jgi:tetratricopeptide (TPR) repeat protein